MYDIDKLKKLLDDDICSLITCPDARDSLRLVNSIIELLYDMREHYRFVYYSDKEVV